LTKGPTTEEVQQ